MDWRKPNRPCTFCVLMKSDGGLDVGTQERKADCGDQCHEQKDKAQALAVQHRPGMMKRNTQIIVVAICICRNMVLERLQAVAHCVVGTSTVCTGFTYHLYIYNTNSVCLCVCVSVCVSVCQV